MTVKRTKDYLFPLIRNSGDFRIDADGSIWTRRDKRGNRTDVWRRAESWHTSKRRWRVYVMGSTYVYAHRLIWFWFNGPIPDGMEVDHDDGDRTNNHPSNLKLLGGTANKQKFHAQRRQREEALQLAA